jgi:hypothetical protein
MFGGSFGGREIRIASKYWEIIADNLKKAGWSLGCVAVVNCEGRTIWIANAHHDQGTVLFVQG